MIKRSLKILLHTGDKNDDGYNLRRWFVFFIVYMAALAAVALISLAGVGTEASQFPKHTWLLALYLFYMSLCCTFFPAPTAWLVLLMASPMIGLDYFSTANAYLNTIATIMVVAAVGALGTAVANLNEYYVFTFALRFGRAHKLRHTRLYKSAAHWFEVSPFVLMTAVSFLPIPVDVIRWLAITHRYRRDYFFAASFIGRFLRYALLAATAACLRISWYGIVFIQLILLTIILLRYLPRLTRLLKKDSLTDTHETVPEQDTVSA